MNLLALQCFVEAGRTLNFTKAAQNLFISQQNLSKHIRNLEEYYKTTLFERKPRLVLTDAGKELMKFAEALFAQERTTKDAIIDITQQRRGTLSIGASSPRARVFLPDLIKIFAPQYPMVQIQLVNRTSDELEGMVATGQLDMAVGIFPEAPSSLKCIPLLHDHIYLTVADALLYRCLGDGTAEFKRNAAGGIQITDVLSLPLIFPSARNRLSHTLLTALQKAGARTINDLNVYMYATYPQYYIDICVDGLASAFITQMTLFNELSSLGNRLNYYPLCEGNEPFYHSISLLYRETAHQPVFKQIFRGLIIKHFEQESQLRLLQAP